MERKWPVEQQVTSVSQPLPFCRYTFTIRVLEPLRLPDFAGSMLRGAFGHALRQLACMTRMKDCKGCPLLTSCPYAQIFETPPPEHHPLQKFSAVPNPYVIEPPECGARVLESGEEFRFSMVLIGKALLQLPLIIMAWERALQRGLSTKRVPCTLLAIHRERDTEAVYRPGANIRRHDAVLPPALSGATSIALEFLTPLRLQRQGSNVGLRELDSRTLLIALARRYQLLCDTQLGQPPQLDFAALAEAGRTIRLAADMRWRDWTRYSSRQKQAMTLGGLTGSVELSGDLQPFMPLLVAGQWLHVGKKAVFGLGRYRLHM